jgi:hypothetical protein
MVQLRRPVRTPQATAVNPADFKASSTNGQQQNIPWWIRRDANDFWVMDNHGSTLDGGSKDAADIAGYATNWVGVSIVMMTRWPFLRQLHAILKHHYCVHIQSRLNEWENSVLEVQPNHAVAGLSGHADSLPPLTLWLSDIIIKLCVDLPVPIPGLFSIRLNLPGDHSYRVLMQREKKFMCSIQDNILFRLKFSETLPDTHFSLEELLYALGPRATIDVICCALMQCKLLFHSEDLSKLPGEKKYCHQRAVCV